MRCLVLLVLALGLLVAQGSEEVKPRGPGERGSQASWPRGARKSSLVAQGSEEVKPVVKPVTRPNCYDRVLKLISIRYLLNPSIGIEEFHCIDEEYRKVLERIQVRDCLVFFGPFDSGKTYFVINILKRSSNIVDIFLPSGREASTVGLSLKYAEVKGQWYLFIDVAGTGMAVDDEVLLQDIYSTDRLLLDTAMYMGCTPVWITNEVDAESVAQFRSLQTRFAQVLRNKYKEIFLTSSPNITLITNYNIQMSPQEMKLVMYLVLNSKNAISERELGNEISAVNTFSIGDLQSSSQDFILEVDNAFRNPDLRNVVYASYMESRIRVLTTTDIIIHRFVFLNETASFEGNGIEPNTSSPTFTNYNDFMFKKLISTLFSATNGLTKLNANIEDKTDLVNGEHKTVYSMQLDLHWNGLLKSFFKALVIRLPQYVRELDSWRQSPPSVDGDGDGSAGPVFKLNNVSTNSTNVPKTMGYCTESSHQLLHACCLDMNKGRYLNVIGRRSKPPSTSYAQTILNNALKAVQALRSMFGVAATKDANESNGGTCDPTANADCTTGTDGSDKGEVLSVCHELYGAHRISLTNATKAAIERPTIASWEIELISNKYDSKPPELPFADIVLEGLAPGCVMLAANHFNKGNIPSPGSRNSTSPNSNIVTIAADLTNWVKFECDLGSSNESIPLANLTGMRLQSKSGQGTASRTLSGHTTLEIDFIHPAYQFCEATSRDGLVYFIFSTNCTVSCSSDQYTCGKLTPSTSSYPLWWHDLLVLNSHASASPNRIQDMHLNVSVEGPVLKKRSALPHNERDIVLRGEAPGCVLPAASHTNKAVGTRRRDGLNSLIDLESTSDVVFTCKRTDGNPSLTLVLRRYVPVTPAFAAHLGLLQPVLSSYIFCEAATHDGIVYFIYSVGDCQQSCSSSEHPCGRLTPPVSNAWQGFADIVTRMVDGWLGLIKATFGKVVDDQSMDAASAMTADPHSDGPVNEVLFAVYDYRWFFVTLLLFVLYSSIAALLFPTPCPGPPGQPGQVRGAQVYLRCTILSVLFVCTLCSSYLPYDVYSRIVLIFSFTIAFLVLRSQLSMTSRV